MTVTMKTTLEKPVYATMKEACSYIRIPYETGRRAEVWMEWKEKYGVRISRVGKRLIMPYTDLDAMVAMREIV